MDPVAGTAHFRVPIRQGLALMRALRGHLSGLCVPQYMIDLPGGGGKIPLVPDYVQETGEETMQVENYRDRSFNDDHAVRRMINRPTGCISRCAVQTLS